MWYSMNKKSVINPRDATQYLFIDVVCFIIHLVWMVLFFYERIILLGVLDMSSCILYIYLHYTISKGLYMRTIAMFYAEVIIHSITALLCLGFTGGFDLYILIFIPVMFFYSFIYEKGQHIISIGGVIAGVVYIILKVIMFYIKPRFAFSDPMIELGVMVFNCVMCIFCLLTITFITCKEINQNRHELEVKNEKLTFLSCHDPLTRLLNRRSMEEIIDSLEVNRGSKNDNAVAFFDVDNFKSFNDQYGHECGDVVLVKVAELICSSLNSSAKDSNVSNYVCRWGGEEIIVLFHNWDRDAVVHMVTQIKDAIGGIDLDFSNEVVSVSVTCGLAFESGKPELRELINEADSYMLKGKRSGKNCIVQG